MEARLRNIGTSKGVIIPKAFIDELGLRDVVEMTLVDGSLVLKPKPRVRLGWAEAAERIGREPLTDWEQQWLDFADPHILEDWAWD